MNILFKKRGIAAAWDEALGNIAGLGLRVVVHIAALILAFMLPDSGLKSFLFFYAYVGIICLVPRGMALAPAWVGPSLLGLLQALLLLLFGMDVHLALFFGGAQTWLQRLIGKKGRMGLEWAALPLLLSLGGGFIASPPTPPVRPEVDMMRQIPGVYKELSPLRSNSIGNILQKVPDLYEKINPAPETDNPLAPLASFPLLAVLGQACALAYARFYRAPLNKKRMNAASAALGKHLNGKKLPPKIEAPARILADYAAMYAGHGLFSESFYPALAQGLERINVQLDLVENSLARNRTMVPDGFSQELADNLPHPVAGNDSADQIEETVWTINHISQQIYERLMDMGDSPKKAAAQAPENTEAARFSVFHESVRTLEAKRALLPAELRTTLDNICRSAECILECMKQDPMDLSEGSRFLTRYLKAAQTVVDEYSRLAASGASSAEITQVLEHSRSLLARMEEAFAGEHAALLRNDAMSLKAELNVLDALLKMDGR